MLRIAVTQHVVVVHHATHSISLGALIGYVVGVVGLALALLREWFAARERRRARPVVICNEVQKRHLDSGRWVALAYISNESATSAFNIRFGVNMDGVHVGWKHSDTDIEPSRLNVLRPQDTWPEPTRPAPVVIPDEIVFGGSRDNDPDYGRFYWAYYQSPGGDWWYTSNPVGRGDDLTIRRIRSRRLTLSRHKRKLDEQIREGANVIREIERGVRDAAQPPPDEDVK